MWQPPNVSRSAAAMYKKDRWLTIIRFDSCLLQRRVSVESGSINFDLFLIVETNSTYPVQQSDAWNQVAQIGRWVILDTAEPVCLSPFLKALYGD